ncbi:MAG TPA: prolyl oligopeptidase family serine peptidase [Candidatus Baltobacteraceae bacterium]|nr:prolyl oligopeptidase family serine peptidase [Candidatus Baltobacteraceae bacterium]
MSALGLRQPGSSAAWAAVTFPTPPPAAAVHPVTETLFGTKIVDRYRFLENMSSPKVQAFFRSQNTYAQAVLANLGVPREHLLERIQELNNAGVGVGSVQVVGNRYFYQKLEPGQSNERLYVRDVAPGSPETLLVDPQATSPQLHQHQSLNFFAPSPDGKYVAYGISGGGSEQATIHVIEVATRTVLSDEITRGDYGVTSWLPDGKSFLYIRLQKLAPGAPSTAKYENQHCYLHVLGRNADDDPAVFGAGLDPNISFAPYDSPSITISPVSPYAIGVISHGVQNEQTIEAAPVDSVIAGHPIWTKVLDTDAQVTNFDVKGDTIYLLSHEDASNYKVLAERLDTPDLNWAVTVVPPGDAVVSEISVANDGLYVRSRQGGFGRIERFPLAADGSVTGPATPISLPYPGAIDLFATDPRDDGGVFGLTAWTKSLRYFSIDAQGAVTDSLLKPASPIDESAYEGREVFATSADGTKIPLSIVAAKNLQLDGSHAAYLEGYGAYGLTIEPYFSATRLAWLERGGVYAVCHVRGGGWYGEAWHRAGMISTKEHTIDDFVACGQYLVTHGYSSPKHLAGEGTSAGGITIGGAITRHPELFAAALDVVGVSDALRSEFSPNGPSNIPEFGSVKTEVGFKALLQMDAYQHVHDHAAYPAVMLITGINDPRVPPWELAKMTARLQAATSSRRPILLRVDYDAGHGFLNASRTQADELLADEYSFLLWQLGDPAFKGIPTRVFHRQLQTHHRDRIPK